MNLIVSFSSIRMISSTKSLVCNSLLFTVSLFLKMHSSNSNFPTPIPNPTSPPKCTTPEGNDGLCITYEECKAIPGGVNTSETCSSCSGICCMIELKLGENYQSGNNKVTVQHNPTHLKSGGGKIGVYEVPKVSAA